MKEEIIFGVAYYPEYMPYDRIDKDLEMMKKAGMNTIRIAESTWSCLEPKEGIYDFSYIDQTLEKAQEYGIHVIIGTPTYAVAPWMAKKYPEIMVEKKDKRAFYGHRQLMDITNPDFRRLAEGVIRALIEHTAIHPCVVGFQLDNETKHYDCYSSYMQDGFRSYLKEKFQTPEKLNQTFYLNYWSNSIHSWEELFDMRGCVHAGLMGEYDVYRRKMVSDYIAWQANIVREYKKDGQFITHNLDFSWKKFGADIAQDGYSYGVQPDADHAGIAKSLSLSGCDIYHPTQDNLTGAEIAFGGDEIRSLKHENYLVLENQAQAFKYWTPYPRQILQQAFSHLASGAMGTMYWNWHSIHNGYETYWKGVLSHDLEVNPVYEEAAKIGQLWKMLGAENLLLEKNNKVALIVDNKSLTAFEWFPIDKDLSYNDVVRWMYDSSYELNIECDIIFAEEIEKGNACLSSYKLVLVPVLYSCSKTLLEIFRDYIKSGGTMLATFRSFVADEHLSVYADRQPYLLSECFGVHYNQFTEPVDVKLSIGGKTSQVKYWADLLIEDTAKSLVRYDHPYWKKFSAITLHHYERGKALYLGAYTDRNLCKEVLKIALKEAGLECSSVVWPLIVRKGNNRKGKKISYIFNYSKEEKTYIHQEEKARDLLSQKIINQGEEIIIKDWGFLVLETI